MQFYNGRLSLIVVLLILPTCGKPYLLQHGCFNFAIFCNSVIQDWPKLISYWCSFHGSPSEDRHFRSDVDETETEEASSSGRDIFSEHGDILEWAKVWLLFSHVHLDLLLRTLFSYWNSSIACSSIFLLCRQITMGPYE